MQYSTLGRTGIKVSKICLGTMTYGEQNSEAEAHEQLDYAVERGVNFFDTAEMYPIDPRAETQGRTEEYIGTWLKRRQDRDKLIVATKVSGAASDWLKYIRGGPKLVHSHIEEAIHGSLKRLQTDYIDLYQIHWPARTTNYFGRIGYQHQPDDDATPIEETLEALAAFVEQGKILHLGVSNETPWGVMHFVRLAEQRSLPRIVSIQNPYNLLNRSFEIGLGEVAHREDVGLLAYSPLGFGVLSGKYLENPKLPGARMTIMPRFKRYSSEVGVKTTRRYIELAQQHGLHPAQMALAYVNTRGFVTANIIGATTMAQLEEDIDSIDVTLSKEVLKAIEDIHTSHANPCP